VPLFGGAHVDCGLKGLKVSIKCLMVTGVVILAPKMVLADQIDSCPPASSIIMDQDFHHAPASREAARWESQDPGSRSLLLQFAGGVFRPLKESSAQRELVGYLEGCTYKSVYDGKGTDDVILMYKVAQDSPIKVMLKDSTYWHNANNALGRQRLICTNMGFQACAFTVLNAENDKFTSF